MTANPKTVLGVLVGTAVFLVGLGLWIGYRSGEVSLFGGGRVTGHEIPKALAPEEGSAQSQATSMTEQKTNESNPVVTLATDHGDITLELYQDAMPITVGNFLALAEKNFYDGTKFHRVIADFMIQGGDPNTKTDKIETYGAGGPGYTIQDEFVKDPRLSNVRGTIAMANTGVPDSGGSQFFINVVDNVGLDFDKPPETSSHPVFGKVIAGMDVANAIAKVPTDKNGMPLLPVVVTDVIVQR
jgi:peptidylprolyl isomerase